MPTHQHTNPWPKGVIPYVINHPEFKDAILAGMRTWEAKAPVRFIERTTEGTYVEFTPGTDHGNNTKPLGYEPGTVTKVNLAEGSRATHEIGHVLGLMHEQRRSDRDSYVVILWENVESCHDNANFRIDPNSDNQGLPYEPESVMQYGRSWGSSNDKDTEKWIGDPSQGIQKRQDWETLIAHDVHAANRLYVRAFPDHDDLIIYRGATGYINNNFTTADMGLGELWAVHRSEDYSLMAAYRSADRHYLVIYRASDGYVNTNVINEDGSIIEIWGTPEWTGGYSLMATYVSGGQPHVVLYRASDGRVNTNVISEGGIIREIWNNTWTKDYSLMATYVSGDKPHLVIYRASDGYVNTNVINEDGSVAEIWNTTQWTGDYSLMATYVSGGRPHLVMYRAADGRINTNVINDDGSIAEIWTDTWTKNYSLLSVFQSEGRPYLAIYRKESGYILTAAISEDGSVNETWNTHWTKGYTLMATTAR